MFFTKYLKPFLIIGGAITMYAAIYAFWPQWALAEMNELPYDNQYLFIIRHWGIMVGLMGFFIIACAFVPRWRESIVLYSFVEKLFMVYLYTNNALTPETAWLNEFFIPFALTDITICVYTLGYWYELHKAKKADTNLPS